MKILGIQGSPRKKGSSDFLLSSFLETAEKEFGAETKKIHIVDYDIKPCIGCYVCKKEKECNIDDDLKNKVFPSIFSSDIVVISSPIYFANIPAYLKNLIDRAQEFWVKRYIFKEPNFVKKDKFGFFLSVAGSDEKDVFDVTTKTIKYFFDSLGFIPKGSLCFGNIQNEGDIKKKKNLKKDIKQVIINNLL